MNYWKFFKENESIKNDIINWWNSEFSERERKHIRAVNSWLPDVIEYITKNEIADNLIVSCEIREPSIVSIFWISSSWFDNNDDRYIAIKLLNKAQEFLKYEIPLVDVHFLYSQIITVNYKDRIKNSDSIEIVIQSCYKQIEIASQMAIIFKNWASDGFIPRHIGYERLAILFEKDKRFIDTINICKKAFLEGWNGEWEKRIERCKKKLDNDKFIIY